MMGLSKRGMEMRAARLTMEYARAHDIGLVEAKAQMAKQRSRDADALLARLSRCGTDARKTRIYAPTVETHGGSRDDNPWMMRD